MYNSCVLIARYSVWHRTATVHLVIFMWITSCKFSWYFAVNCMISTQQQHSDVGLLLLVLMLCVMFNILSQFTVNLEVKFLGNEEQHCHCLLPSLVDDFTCIHSENALLTRILSTLFSSTCVLSLHTFWHIVM